MEIGEQAASADAESDAGGGTAPPAATAGPASAQATAAPPTVAIDVPAGVTRIGREADNDVVLDDPAVAPRHAELISTPEGVRLRDVSDAGGIRLNGQLIASALLADGDELAIGRGAWTYAAGRLEPRVRDEKPLRAKHVGVRAGSATLLANVDLVVEEGELLAVIGPSGAGKSTLLHVLAGLRAPSSGRVLMRGSDVSLRQSDLGFVPQDDTVHRRLTAREALRFAARLRLPEDSTGEACDAAVERALVAVDLLTAADRPIRRLSGGQRKRVALAQELLGEPSVLLLDEPTSGLDPGLEHRMMLLMRELAAGPRSVVVVTHTVGHLDVCDRVVVMAPGGIVAAVGAPTEVLATLGAATFEDVFVRLDALEPPAPEAESAPTATPRSSAGRVQAKRRSVRRQTPILTRRYALLMLRDRRNLRLLLMQTLLLSLGASLLFGGDVFARRDGVTLHAGSSAQLLFLMVTMALWFGAITAARQIVAERSVLTRELNTGVRTEAYLLSKAIVLGTLAAAQTVLMAMVVFFLRPLGGASDAVNGVVLILVLCSWAGVAFGLVVSTYARSEDQAASFIPLVLLPQLLFGGALVPLAQLSGAVAAIANLVAARWGFAAVGHAVEMNDRIANDDAFAAVSRYGPHFFSLGTVPAALVLSLLAAACAAVLQAHLRPSFEDTWWQQMRFRAWERWQERQRGPLT